MKVLLVLCLLTIQLSFTAGTNQAEGGHIQLQKSNIADGSKFLDNEAFQLRIARAPDAKRQKQKETEKKDIKTSNNNKKQRNKNKKNIAKQNNKSKRKGKQGKNKKKQAKGRSNAKNKMRKRKKKHRRNKAKKGKNRKNKKRRNRKDKTRKRKNRKNKTKRRKNRKNRNKRKNNKNKNKRKNNKNKKKKNIKIGQRQVPDSCFVDFEKYAVFFGREARNYYRQATRAKKRSERIASKLEKNNTFDADYQIILASLGGNPNNLTCNGNAPTSEESGIISTLGNCSQSIISACVPLPADQFALMEQCELAAQSYRDAFIALTNNNNTPSQVCANLSSLFTLESDTRTKCNRSQEIESSITAAKTSCDSAFKDCKSSVIKAIPVVFECTPCTNQTNSSTQAPVNITSSTTSSGGNSSAATTPATTSNSTGANATSTGSTGNGTTATGSTGTGSSSTGSTGTGSTSTGTTATGSSSTGSTGTGSSSTGSTGTGSTSTGSTGTGSTTTGSTTTGSTTTGSTTTGSTTTGSTTTGTTTA